MFKNIQWKKDNLINFNCAEQHGIIDYHVIICEQFPLGP